MKLAIIEPSKTGVEHLSFNDAMLQGLKARPQVTVRLYCSDSHAIALAAGVPWVKLPVISITRRAFFRKLAVEFIALVYSLLRARFWGAERIVLLSVFTPLLCALPALARLTGTKPLVVLHGELDGLLDPRRRRPTSYGYWIKRFFDHRMYKRLRCVVLGSGIRQRLAEIYPDVTEHTIAIEHPIVPVPPARDHRRRIAVATFGIATRDRFGRFYAAVAALPAEHRPRITHVGMVDAELYAEFHQTIEFLSRPDCPLSKADYEAAASRVNCAVSLYERSDYRLRVSGAMLDALRAGARLVSLSNAYAIDLQRDGFDVQVATSIEEVLNLLDQSHHERDADFSALRRYSVESAAHRLLAAQPH